MESKSILSEKPIFKDEDVYERELNESTFKLYMDALINLPFVMTNEQIEPNKITVRSRNGTRDHEFQIWRDNDEEYGFTMSSGGRIDPNTFNLKGTKYDKTNDHLIELIYGPHLVDPVNYQNKIALVV